MYVCTFSLLGEKGEGVVFSRPLRALRAAICIGKEVPTPRPIYPPRSIGGVYTSSWTVFVMTPPSERQ